MPTPSTPPELATEYRFDALLGTGSQGRTFRATRLADGLAVAIKAITLTDIDDWKALELFQREAQALQHLDITGVPKLIESRQIDTPTTTAFYLIQTLMEGRSLLDLLDSGTQFSEDDAIHIAHQIAIILQQLHQHRPPIIHRDIKPANILLRHDHNCALVDLGAVTQPNPQRGESTVIGTFGYMPPEQLHGQALPASDLYALGATLVHLLAGIPPYQMEHQRFRLCFHPHLDVSPAMLNLLERLLDPDHRLRLATAQQLIVTLEELRNAPATVTWATTAAQIMRLGQPGHRTLFEQLPEAPRRADRAYHRAFLAPALRYTLATIIAPILAVAVVALGWLDMEGLLLGLLPLFALIHLLHTRRQTLRLLRQGLKVEATITKLEKRSDRTRVHYRFDYHGPREAYLEVDSEQCALVVGQSVGALVLPQDPHRSTLYPPPPRALPDLAPQ